MKSKGNILTSNIRSPLYLNNQLFSWRIPLPDHWEDLGPSRWVLYSDLEQFPQITMQEMDALS